jgi:folate-binding protein YgfZ
VSETGRDAMGSGAVWYARTDWATVRVSGRDAAGYLHRMTSQDVAGLTAGRATYACVLTPQGRILGDPVIWHMGDHLLLDLAAAARDGALPALERAVIADDVSFEDTSRDQVRFVLVGKEAASVLDTLGVTPPKAGTYARARIVGGEDVRILRRDLGTQPGFEWLVPRENEPQLLELVDGVERVTPVDDEAWDALRIAEGVPSFGAELTADVMPLEARLDDVAISWTKGCYPGQEPVAKARHRGKPPHLLVRLQFSEGCRKPLAGQVLLHQGRRVGRLTTATGPSPAEAARGLGYVRHALAVEGSELEAEDGSVVRVLAWPATSP